MRYIDADAICTYFKALAEQAEMEGLYNMAHIYKRCLQLVNDAPTADVVPRAEVTKLVGQYYDKCDECRTKYARGIANEIFEDIEIEIVAALRSNYSAKQERVEKQIPDDFVSYMCEGKIAALRGIADFIAEFKKKYKEDE